MRQQLTQGHIEAKLHQQDGCPTTEQRRTQHRKGSRVTVTVGSCVPPRRSFTRSENLTFQGKGGLRSRSNAGPGIHCPPSTQTTVTAEETQGTMATVQICQIQRQAQKARLEPLQFPHLLLGHPAPEAHVDKPGCWGRTAAPVLGALVSVIHRVRRVTRIWECES